MKKKNGLTQRKAHELFGLWCVGHDLLVKNKDGQCYHVDHGRAGDLIKTDERWEDPEYGFDENVFVKTKYDYEIVSWSDESPLDVYDYLMNEGWVMVVNGELEFIPRK